jgi:hypothetical protein
MLTDLTTIAVRWQRAVEARALPWLRSHNGREAENLSPIVRSPDKSCQGYDIRIGTIGAA